MNLNSQTEISTFFRTLHDKLLPEHKERALSVCQDILAGSDLSERQLKWIVSTSKYQRVPIPDCLSIELGLTENDIEPFPVQKVSQERVDHNVHKILNMADSHIKYNPSVAEAVAQLAEAVKLLAEALKG